MAHYQFLPREDTVAVINRFVQQIDVNIATVTASLVVRRQTPIRAKIEVPSPAAPSPAPRRRTVPGSPQAIAAGLHLGFTHGPPNSGDGPASEHISTGRDLQWHSTDHIRAPPHATRRSSPSRPATACRSADDLNATATSCDAKVLSGLLVE